MVEHQPAAELRGGVNVHAEHLGGAALQEPRGVLAAVAPQVMRHPVRLDGVVALEIQEGGEEIGDRGVAVTHGQQVFGGGGGDFGVVLHRLQDQRGEAGGAEIGIFQFVGEAVGQRVGEAFMGEQAVLQRAHQHGLAGGGLAAFGHKLVPGGATGGNAAVAMGHGGGEVGAVPHGWVLLREGRVFFF